MLARTAPPRSTERNIAIRPGTVENTPAPTNSRTAADRDAGGTAGNVAGPPVPSHRSSENAAVRTIDRNAPLSPGVAPRSRRSAAPRAIDTPLSA